MANYRLTFHTGALAPAGEPLLYEAQLEALLKWLDGFENTYGPRSVQIEATALVTDADADTEFDD